MNQNIYRVNTLIFLCFVAIMISCNNEYSGNSKNNKEAYDNHDGHDHDEHNHEGHNHDEHDHKDHDGNEEHDHKGHDHSEHNHEVLNHEGENSHAGVHLTAEQINTVGLEFGEFSSVKVNDFIKATGALDVPPNAYASVSAKAEGIITGTKKYVEGDFINKGDVIAYLENPDFIVTQQEYLDAKAQFGLKSLELERQKKLVNANAGVSKNLQVAQTEVAVLEAKSVGLSKQLNYLGISTSSLTPKTISSKIAIVAPMSGYISNISFHNGMYAQPSIALMDIISSDHLHLELDVFEKDISQVKIGQKISYTIPALGNSIFEGEVSVIGKEFNSNSKTVRIHGHLIGDKPQFLKGLFINARVWLSDDATTALPEKAIIQDGNNALIYVAKMEADSKEIQFTALTVVAGATNNGYTAVKLIDPIPKGMQIVTKGAYYVYAQSQAGELEHEH
jgi:cobalt-zinc-cadmium efflux system membrane fusion protein